MIRSYSFASEHAFDLIPILKSDFSGHHHLHLFHKLLAALCALFPVLHFDLTKTFFSHHR